MWPSHGSNPQYLYESMGMTMPKQYLDFSANINPLGPPEALKKNWNEFFKRITDYPDPYALHLKEQISIKEQISPDSLLMGNGGAELITLAARMLAGKKILLVQPAFSEYEQACRMNQCEIICHQLEAPDFELNLDRLLPKIREADAMFFCNPNNPTGIQFSESDIITMMEECEKNHSWFILDEAFYDFLEDYESFIPCIKKFSNLIIIRSMTKMFAIPGIRLGYLAAQPTVIAALQKLQPHWSINAIALAAGELCLKDEAFIQRTRDYIGLERKWLFEQYKQKGFAVSFSKVNFYLLREPALNDLYELFVFLMKHGIIPRHTINFSGLEGKWLRFAIKSTRENQQLMEVLNQWRKLHH